MTWLLNSDVGQLRRQQAIQRLVETATATNKNANTVVKYYQGHGFLLKNTERLGFEFQTRDICTPLRGPQYSKNEGSNQVVTGTRPVAFQE